MAADRESLVRLGQLCFDDFLLLSRETLDAGHWTPEMAADWSLALNNAPHILLHLRRSDNLQSAICNLQFNPDGPCPSTASIASAQSRLVHAFAYELLRAKAPPLYDSLPWHDWDFSIVARRFKLWQTRFLLAGDGTTVTMCRCRKSAGVYIVEPDKTIARYAEQKAAIEKVRRVRVLNSSVAPSLLLPAASVDLAIVGSIPSLDTGSWRLVIRELLRCCANVLMVENNPLCSPLADAPLVDAGFRSDTIIVSGLGPRRCWWLMNKLEVRNQKLD
jgi:hypothetical protein